ncbi:MAG: RecX family transcriptional regulator [Bacteroidales bacterium]|nr:RecX family transcriptional regulator [Bacteroidales bacterium]
MNDALFEKVAGICARKEMCEYDVRKYLAKFKSLLEEENNEIVAKLKTGGFIDEYRYATSFANDAYKYNKWGKYKIIFVLRGKGIPEIAISSAIAAIDEELYGKIKKELAETKRKSLAADDPQREKKVKAYMYGRGFVE